MGVDPAPGTPPIWNLIPTLQQLLKSYLLSSVCSNLACQKRGGSVSGLNTMYKFLRKDLMQSPLNKVLPLNYNQTASFWHVTCLLTVSGCSAFCCSHIAKPIVPFSGEVSWHFHNSQWWVRGFPQTFPGSCATERAQKRWSQERSRPILWYGFFKNVQSD